MMAALPSSEACYLLQIVDSINNSWKRPVEAVKVQSGVKRLILAISEAGSDLLFIAHKSILEVALSDTFN